MLYQERAEPNFILQRYFQAHASKWGHGKLWGAGSKVVGTQTYGTGAEYHSAHENEKVLT